MLASDARIALCQDRRSLRSGLPGGLRPILLEPSGCVIPF